VFVEVPYGRERLPLKIPAGLSIEVLRPNPPETLPEEEVLLREALDRPIGAPPLEEIVKTNQRVVIICDDITRPTPTQRVLPAVVERLRLAGIADDHIQIVMALGSHRPMTDVEIRAKIGDALWRQIPAVNSEFRDRSKLVQMPGIPGAPNIWIDRRVAEADVRIGVGGLLPHPAAGWSGGAKIIFPGIAGEETVAAFHLLHARTPWNMLGTVDNPVRRAMESWVGARVGLEFIINVVSTAEGRIVHAVAGHFIAAHREGVAYARGVLCARSRRQADIVVTTSHRADGDFWQGGKGLLTADLAASDGGTVILVTPCVEGVGPHPRYLEYLSEGSADQLLEQADRLSPSEQLPLAVAAATIRIRQRHQIGIISGGLTPDQIRLARMVPFATPQEALDEAVQRHGPGARVTVLPYGGEVVPIL
jgi:nickel-dependent lactate racemase